MKRLTGILAAGTALLLSACAANPVAAPATAMSREAGNGRVHEHTLANGLRIFVKEDHRAPVAVSQLWYKVGASYEHDGITGISHVLEHMMFQGTPKYPAGRFSRIIADQGGSENAFTAYDYTAYFQQLEKSRLPIAFKLEADRMHNLALPPKNYAKELKVVMEERYMRTDDNPVALTNEQFDAAAFQLSPYHNPIIGWRNDIEHLTVQDVRKWYRAWYAPNNAILVVAGDVDPQRVFAEAERYFGPIEPSVITPPKPRVEPVQLGERRIVVKAPAEVPYLIMGYKAPVLKTAREQWKPYALDVLAAVLDGGDSARFPRELVRGRQIASNVSAGYDMTARLADLFTFSGTPAKGHTVQQLERAIRAQIDRLKREPVSAAELARIKAQVTAAKVYQQDSVFYQAMQIGALEAVGLDWRIADTYPQRIAAVTPAQIMAVAKEYFTDDHLTVAVLEPQPLDGKGRRMALPQGDTHAIR